MPIPTYRQIAQACGVSTATVSRALRHDPRVRPGTRDRVWRTARKLGWQPNPLAAAHMAHLRSSRPATFKAQLAFVIDWPTPVDMSELPGAVYKTYLGASKRAAAAGYSLAVHSPHDPDMSMQTIDRVLYNRNTPGIIFASFADPGATVEGLTWSQYAAVCLGFTMGWPRIDRVACNVAQAIELAITRAFALGYKHLGVVVSREYDQRTGHGMLHPLHYAQNNLGPDEKIDLLRVESTSERHVPRITRWLDEHRPQIVMGTYVYEAIQALGWRVPQDIAFISVDRDALFSHHAGIDQRHELTGQFAADLLIARITHNQRGLPDAPVYHLLDGVWIDGPSAPAISRRP